MNNQEADKLIQAINDYMNASIKKDYKYDWQEDYMINKAIERLDNHLKMLYNEIKDEGK